MGEMLAGEILVGRAGIDDDADAGLVDRAASVVNLSLSPQRTMGRLPSASVAVEKAAIFSRAGRIVTPPTAMSNLSAAKSSFSFAQIVGTNSTRTPSAVAS